jgi:hypothetical protein
MGAGSRRIRLPALTDRPRSGWEAAMDVETTDQDEFGRVTEGIAGDHGLPMEMGGREDWAGLSAE